MSSDRNLVGDHPWLGGTTYGAVDSPARPSMAAIDSPARPSMATKFAIDGPVGPVVGGTIGGVTGLFFNKAKNTINNSAIICLQYNPMKGPLPHKNKTPQILSANIYLWIKPAIGKMADDQSCQQVM